MLKAILTIKEKIAVTGIYERIKRIVFKTKFKIVDK